MKHILAPILLLTFLFPSLVYGETMDDLVKREGIFYKKFTDVPFTGKVTGKIQGSFKNGKEHGPWVTYYKGKLSSKGTYKNGVKVGLLTVYHEDGKLFYKGTLKDGKKNGPWISYHNNGQLRSKGTFRDGKKEGPWVFYKKDGTKRFTRNAAGSLIFDEGSGTYKNGVKVK
jgi:antitoxin component YwqK of YwqJK toxin-antitoxin module